MTREPESMNEAAHWLFSYFYNVGPLAICEAVYGKDHHPSYIKEKIDVLLEGGPVRFYGGLDDEHQARLAEAIKERYGNGIG